MLNKKALSATAGVAAEPVYVEDVFATHIYDGTGSSNTITNGIDLSGEGGLVWIKRRNAVDYHVLQDTLRGTSVFLSSNLTNENSNSTTVVTAFNNNGFTVGTNSAVNSSSNVYASWTFRKAAKFFDVVTYTGTGSARTVSHNLGSVPGCIIVKRTDAAGDWAIYHRSRGNTKFTLLNTSGLESTSSTYWNNTTPTSTVFTVGTNANVNANGGTYVAYLFAHAEAAFGDNSDKDIIKCGEVTGTGTLSVTLDWEPAFVFVKGTAVVGDGRLIDSVRGMPAGLPSGFACNALIPNGTDAENNFTPTSFGNIAVKPNGFDIYNDSGSSETFIYIAIRRGPMKTPTDATKVFKPTVYTGTNVDGRLINTTIDPDFVMIRQRNDTVVPGMYTGARLTNTFFMITGSTNAAATDDDSFDDQLVGTKEMRNSWASMSGVYVGNDATRKFNINTTSNNHIIHAFKRAPGFFDVVCYTGTGSATTISHNLGVAPELIIVKRRDAAANNWWVYAEAIGNTDYLQLNGSAGEATGTNYWNSTSPTSSVFSLGNATAVNASGGTFLAVMFASLTGVSKVGSYTGNGTSQTINCGFTAGARYILIKRTDSADDWAVFDSARGIVAGSDPYLQLNATSAEVTNQDIIDSDSSGFIVNTNDKVNANGGTYIYLAIA